jgi:acyl phosphate:glycerol-3-phosphate acyltransferase
VIPSWALLLAGSYLLGSVSFSLMIVRLVRRVDVRTVGSGNAGATNVLRTSGRWPALLVLLLDIAKGVVPVRVAQALGAPSEIAAGAGLAAIAGHVYPVFFGFRGGKGVATGFGVFVALFPLAGAAALALFVGVGALTRVVSLGSMVAAASVPPLAAAFARIGWAPPVNAVELILTAAGAALVLFRHRSNLARLWAGTERRLGRGADR